MVRIYMLYPGTVFYENKKVHQPRWSEINAKKHRWVSDGIG